MKRPGLPWVVVFVLAIATAYAGRESDSQERVVPSQMCGEYFLIPLEVDLDGDGESTTLLALFDTGGAGLHIDPDAVRRAGGGAVEVRKQITIRNATAGPLTFRKLRPYTRELDHLSRPLGIEIDIFLPFRDFADHLLTLDFPRREIRIAEGRLPRPDRVEVFSARGPDRRPYLEVEIAGREHRLLVDSGSSGSIAIEPGRELPWSTAPVPVSVGQGMEQLFYSDLGRLDADIEIGGVTVEQPLVEIRAGTELIGTDIMRRFVWTFDQKSRRMRIRSDSREPLRLPARRGTGAVFLPTPEGYEIARVLAGTPAESAGLRVGDLVVAFDGTPVFERGCERWQEEHRTETTLTVVREGRELDLQVEIIDIVP